MTDKSLRRAYLSDLRRAPEVLEALRAAKRDASTFIVPFDRFTDDPFLLYACCGLAGMDGIKVTVIPPST